MAKGGNTGIPIRASSTASIALKRPSFVKPGAWRPLKAAVA
jgi:hypothetical protein